MSVTANPNSTIITIEDELDVPTFAFTQSRYAIGEINGTLSFVVARYGDISTRQNIRCVTTSGSAREGLDFIALRANSPQSIVTFNSGKKQRPVLSFGLGGRYTDCPPVAIPI